MKLTTTETKQYAMLVVKLSTGASISLAEHNKFQYLTSKMKRPEPGRSKPRTEPTGLPRYTVDYTQPPFFSTPSSTYRRANFSL